MGQFNDAALSLLKQLEGCRLNAYQDQAVHLTSHLLRIPGYRDVSRQILETDR